MVMGFSFNAIAQMNPATPGIIPDTIGMNNNSKNYSSPSNNSPVKVNSNDNTGINFSSDTSRLTPNSWIKKEEGGNSSPLLNDTGVNFNDTGIK